MKRILLVLSSLFCAAQLFAQSASDVFFTKIDENGNEVAVENGAEVSSSTIKVRQLPGEDPKSYVESGLRVKRVNEDGAWISIKYEVLSIDNGKFQCCYSTCYFTGVPGVFYSPVDGSATGAIDKSLEDEWFFEAKGEVKVKFTILIFDDNKANPIEGNSVTVNSSSESAALSTISAANVVSSEYYSLTGVKAAADARGILIRIDCLADGTKRAHRVIVK